MNFNSLANQTMLSQSDEWLNTPETRDILMARPLTKALLVELKAAHDALAEKQAMRTRIFAELGQITDDLSGNDGVHDRKARGLYWCVQGLAECTDDEDMVDRLLDLLARLYPIGLGVVNRSYIDEAGAVVEMQRQVTDDVLAFMKSVQVGNQTLADIYRDWVEAGVTLGRQARERARLQQAISKDGTSSADIDTRGARQDWIRAAGALVSIVEMLNLPPKERERLLAPLERSILEATRNRGSTGDDAGASPAGDAPAGDAPVGDAPVGDAPVDDAPGDAVDNGGDGPPALEAGDVG